MENFKKENLKLEIGVRELSFDDDNKSIDSVIYSIDGKKLAKGWQIEVNDSLVSMDIKFEETSFIIISLDFSELNRGSLVQIFKNEDIRMN